MQIHHLKVIKIIMHQDVRTQRSIEQVQFCYLSINTKSIYQFMSEREGERERQIESIEIVYKINIFIFHHIPIMHPSCFHHAFIMHPSCFHHVPIMHPLYFILSFSPFFFLYFSHHSCIHCTLYFIPFVLCTLYTLLYTMHIYIY